MPARKRTAVGSSGNDSSGAASPTGSHTDDMAYRLKRQRNNNAVKKTREKSKQTAAERKKHVEMLSEENVRLEAKIESEKKHVEMLKSLLLSGVKTEDHEKTIQAILNSPLDDDDCN